MHRHPEAAVRAAVCMLCGRPCVCCGLVDCGCWFRFADYRPLAPRAAGHPVGLEWFCAEHREAASECTNMPSDQALAHLVARFGSMAPDHPWSEEPSLWVLDAGEQPIKVFALLRLAAQLTPAQARERMQTGHFRVLNASSYELKRWHELFTAAGAHLEYRCE